MVLFFLFIVVILPVRRLSIVLWLLEDGDVELNYTETEVE